MTQYTTTHGLPTYDTSDLIAEDSDNLRTKINAVSQAAEIALTKEGARAEQYAKDDATARFGGLPGRVTAVESAIPKALADATAYADAGDAVIRNEFKTSHVALDADGTPFIRFGSMTVKVLQDTDGTPYYEAA